MKGSEKINKILDEIKLQPAQFSKTIGLIPQNIYDIQKDKVDISKDVALKIIESYPQFLLEWLLYGKGEMLKTDKPPVSEKDTQIIELQRKYIEMLEKRVAQLEGRETTQAG